MFTLAVEITFTTALLPTGYVYAFINILLSLLVSIIFPISLYSTNYVVL